ncbi:MAG: hemagglutinin, partial [Prevotella salivae]|nr:hemagglutinin [Segatella salivae]
MKRQYELAIKDRKTADGKPATIWVVMNKDGSLSLVENANEKPKTGGGTTEQPNFGIKHKNQP